MREKLRNYGLWVSLFSLIGILAGKKLEPYIGEWANFTTVILTFLVAAGVISNPGSGKWYSDK